MLGMLDELAAEAGESCAADILAEGAAALEERLPPLDAALVVPAR